MSPETSIPSWRPWLSLGVALLGLNAALSFHNLWPTPWVTLRPELSVEAALLVLLVALVAEWGRTPSRRMLGGLALGLLVLVLGRYAEVTAPALYGRPINLYWDAQHLPGVMAMLAEAAPWWQLVAALAAGLALLLAAFVLLRWMLGQIAGSAALALPRRVMLGLSGGLVTVYALGHLAPETNALRWFSLPVMATYAKQAVFVSRAVAADDAVPRIDAPALAESQLRRVAGADVIVLFLESYGATTFDRPEYAQALAPSRDALRRAVAGTGRDMVSAYVRSPTFGGGSWLAHSSFLAGIEVADNALYDSLLTRQRDTWVQQFARRGYRTVALMPGLRNPWPEGAFYGFDEIYDAAALEYRGPAFGWWRIPDQYALAQVDARELHAGERSPVMLFFTTISSHAPFRPTPPYQPDWQALLGGEPYATPGLADRLAQRPDWMNLGPAYVESVDYALTYLAGYLERRAAGDLVLIIIGDHQPPAGVSGPNAPWDVPVHVVASRPEIMDALRAQGFASGLVPSRPEIGPMHALTNTVLRAFDGDTEPARTLALSDEASGPRGEPRVDVAGVRSPRQTLDETPDLGSIAPLHAREPMTLAD